MNAREQPPSCPAIRRGPISSAESTIGRSLMGLTRETDGCRNDITQSASLGRAHSSFSAFPAFTPQTAALAPLRSHIPPIFETSSSVPIVYSSADFKLPPKLSRRNPFTPAQLLSVAVLLVVFAIQVFRSPTLLSEDDIVVSYFGDKTAPPPVCKEPNLFEAPLPVTRPDKMSLLTEAKRVAAEFEYPAEDLNIGVKAFIEQMHEGLQKTGTSMSQIPTYVTAVTNGTEKGLYLAVDLGGTNFRVCSIELHGDTTFSLTQSKVAIPKELMVAKTSKELFSFLAKQIEKFLKAHHDDHYQADIQRRQTVSSPNGFRSAEIFQLGFTFSFPVNQVGINRGTLARWTKGFDIQDAVGKDVCELLQAEIDDLGLPVKVAALVNDAVGTLMARSYTSPGKTGTLLGAIFGTGTNGAYVEKLSNVTKLESLKGSDYDKSTGEMIVNTEWGSFDNQMSVLPNTPYDEALDQESVNPGIQMFEKRVSGMFLGEILRHAILALIKDPKAELFSDDHSGKNELHSTTSIAEDSALYKQWGLDTSFLSIVAADSTSDLRVVRQTLSKDLSVDAASAEDAEAVKLLVNAIGKRSARLSAVAMAAIVIATGNHLSHGGSVSDDIVDMGVDGSLVEFYPGFEDYIREAFRSIPELALEGEKRIRIGIAKDGSGVGAALIALVAAQADKS